VSLPKIKLEELIEIEGRPEASPTPREAQR
jgi:hypothetical protein